MLICLVILEMVRPRLSSESRADFAARLDRWRLQRQHGRSLDPSPHPDEICSWRDLPESRDWDLLAALKQRDGWTLLSHRREFVEYQDAEPKDRVEFAGVC